MIESSDFLDWGSGGSDLSRVQLRSRHEYLLRDVPGWKTLWIADAQDSAGRCRVEASTAGIVVHPQDGLRKRVRFVPQRINIEVTQGELDTVILSDSGRALELQISDSTGVVKTAELPVEGLAGGAYAVRYGSVQNRVLIADSLSLSVPIAEAKLVRIERV